MTALELLGRSTELATVRNLLGGVWHRGGALILRGPAGIGKSTLLDAAEREAAGHGLRTVRVAGVQAETNLAFAGLHQLLEPFTDGLEDLPAPQRRALAAVFAPVRTPPPEPFLVAFAALGLLARAAATAPVLLLVDDAQWLDPPTGQALAFVARRLGADRIALVAAVRDGHPSPLLEANVTDLRLHPLADQDAAALLYRHAATLPVAVRELLLRQAAGNPLALVELPAAWKRRAHADAAMPEWVPLTTRLERSFAERIAELPEPTRTLGLLAAVNDADSVAEILAGAQHLGLPATVAHLVPAQQSGLFTIDHLRITFRHPLVRSAVYQTATTARRRAAHAALAAVLRDHPDRRAWHLAAAAAGTDDRVAEELDAAARRALSSGGALTALAAWERAAQLCANPHSRAEYLVRAAEVGVDLGQTDAVTDLLKQAQDLPLTSDLLNRLACIRALVDLGTGRADRIGPTLEAIERVSSRDTALALRLLRAAAAYYYRADPTSVDRSRVTAAVERLDLAADDPRRLSILALAAPLEYGGVVLTHLSRITPDSRADPLATLTLGDAASAVGGYDQAEGFFAEAIEGLRRHGREGLLAHALTGQSWVHTYLGRWDSAQRHAAEAVAIAEMLDQPHFIKLAQIPPQLIAALRGAPPNLPEHQAELAPAGLTGAGIILTRGADALTAGRYTEAYGHLRALLDPDSPQHHPVMGLAAIGYLAEAAVRCGKADEARVLLTAVETAAARSIAGKVRNDLAYAHAVLADDADADEAFARALGPDAANYPFDQARAQLSYGEWLRRRRRVVDCRTPLRAALSTFERLGAEPWAQRARRELRSARERLRVDGGADIGALTAQELQVARLAAEGRSNREIAEMLFLSPRTVGSHLYRLFPKLEIASRKDLRAVLAQEERSAGRPAVPGAPRHPRR